jgi:outer membrane protein OmpA-like peptidoglycan-associated protein
MKLKYVLCLFIFLKIMPCYSCQRDTVRLFYNINKKDLTIRHKIALDSLRYFISDTTTVLIFGFADYLGKRDSNYALSRARAETVKNYLISLHAKSTQIVADGKGQVNATTKTLMPLGEPFNRRVEIIIARPAPKIKVAATPIKEPVIIKSPVITGKLGDDSVYTRINDLPKLNVGDSVSFKELTFIAGRHFLRQLAIHYMVALKDCLKSNPGLKIEIQGHICCQYDGKDGLDFDTNKNNLSLARAKYIYDYLLSEGISPERLRYKGLGSKEPKVYPELSAEDQNQNRRVVIVLFGK